MAEIAVLDVTLNPVLDVPKINAILNTLKSSLGNFGAEIKPIDAQKLNDEFRKASGGADGLQDELDELRKRLQELEQQGQKVPKAFQFNQINEQVRNVSQALTDLSRPFVELDTNVRNIGTLGVQNFTEFADAAIELSKSVPDSAGAIAAGVYDAISAGALKVTDGVADVGQGMKFVETASKLAVAGMSTTGDAINGLTSVLNAYKLSVDDAGKISDFTFNAINAGKLSFTELNASLANVVPTAASVGVAYDQVTAALATMTKQGVPAQQASTKLNQALVELQKPGTTLAPVLKKAGVSLESIKAEGLQESLRKVGVALNEMGLTATQAFGSVDAASAVLLLSGDNAQLAADDLAFVSSTMGTTDAAFAVASDSIANKAKVALNNVQAFVNGGLSFLGDGILTAANASAQIAPLVTSLAGLKDIVPEGTGKRVLDLGKSILVTLIPSLAGTNAMQGATAISASAMWTAITGPIGLAIAGIAAIAAAVTLFFTQTEAGKKLWTEMTGYISAFVGNAGELFDAFVDLAGEALNPANWFSDSDNISKAFDKLKDKVSQTMREAENDISQSNLSTALEEAIAIKGDLDKTDQLGKLIEKMKTAKTEAEKQNIAAAIGQSIPSAIQGIRQVTDQATGEISTVYDVSIEKAQEFVDTQKTALSGEITQRQTAFLEGLKGQADQYELNKQRLAELSQEMVEQAKKGEDISGLRERYKELEQKTNDSAKAIKDTIEQGKKTGLITGEVDQLAKKYKFTQQQALSVADATKKIEDAAKGAAQSAATLSKAFEDAKTASSGAFKESSQALAQLLVKQKSGQQLSEAEIAQKKLLIDAGRDAYKQEQQMDAALKESEAALGKVEKKEKSRTSEKKSAFEIASKELEVEKRKLETTEQFAELQRESLRLDANRERTAVDDFVAEQGKLDTIKQQIEATKALFKIQPDGTFGITFKKNSDERQQAEQIVTELNLALAEQENKVKEIKVKALPEFDDKALRQLQFEQVQVDVQLGIKGESAITDFLKGDIDAMQGQLAELTEQKRSELESFRSKGLLSEAAYQSQLALIDTNGTVEQLNILKEIGAKRVEIRDRQYDTELKALERKQDEEERIRAKSVEREKKLLEDVLSLSDAAGSTGIDAVKAKRLERLQAERDQELISDRAFEDEKTRIEQEAASQRTALEARIRGERLEAERQAAIAELEVERARLTEKRDLALGEGKTDEAKQLGEQLQTISSEIKDKGDLITGVTEELQGNLTGLLTNLFKGDPEAIKDPFRQGFNVLAGALKRLASAKITEVLLGSISGLTGIAGVVAAFAGRPIIESLINGILGPVFDSLLSFSTGGRVDQPTIAQIGDAGATGGRDTEWVFRDRDIMAMLSEATYRSSARIVAAIDRLGAKFDEIQFRLHVSGNDLTTAVGRTERDKKRRIIAAGLAAV